jgi:signal transduction histidine kinase
MRRAVAGFGLMFVLVILGAARLVTWIADGFPIVLPQPSAVATFAAIVIVVFASLSLTMRRVGVPLGDIVGAANRVADGDFSTRVREHGPPSLRTVARAFNSMTSRLERQEQQRRHLMADIAHELRTPLTVIQGRLEGLIDGVYARDEARLTQVLTETRMLARLVEDLRTLAHAESGMLALRKEPTDLGILVHDVVTAFADQAAARQIRLEDHAGDLRLVDVDPLRVREILTNLVANALHHTPAQGRVSVDVQVHDDRAAFTVTDTGSGIAAADLPKIFDRFYKGHGSQGSGLGLTISKNLVDAHGGEIRAESRLGHGTTIAFTLPV